MASRQKLTTVEFHIGVHASNQKDDINETIMYLFDLDYRDNFK